MSKRYGYSQVLGSPPLTGSPSGPTGQVQQNVGQTTQRAPKGKKVLHVKLGMGDGVPPWIPTNTDLADAKRDWEAVTDDDTEVIVTHFGTDVEWL